MPFSKEQLERVRINQLFKQARAKMLPGWAYTIDQLLDVDHMSDADVLEVMHRLDTHPLIVNDSTLPRRWRIR